MVAGRASSLRPGGRRFKSCPRHQDKDKGSDNAPLHFLSYRPEAENRKHPDWGREEGGLELREASPRSPTPGIHGSAETKGEARLRVPGGTVAIGLLRDDILLGMFIRGSWDARYLTYHKLMTTVEDLVMAVPSSSSRLPS